MALCLALGPGLGWAERTIPAPWEGPSRSPDPRAGSPSPSHPGPIPLRLDPGKRQLAGIGAAAANAGGTAMAAQAEGLLPAPAGR